MTKITIGIVTFDRINFLKRAVRSVLRQSYKNYIIYIGNDNPKKKINFKDLGLKKNNKIKIFNYKKNIGERKNLNYLLKKSNTDYFCWLGDDDYLHKDFFKILISQFKVNKPCSVNGWAGLGESTMSMSMLTQVRSSVFLQCSTVL